MLESRQFNFFSRKWTQGFIILLKQLHSFLAVGRLNKNYF